MAVRALYPAGNTMDKLRPLEHDISDGAVHAQP
jgi:hypothetical protein